VDDLWRVICHGSLLENRSASRNHGRFRAVGRTRRHTATPTVVADLVAEHGRLRAVWPSQKRDPRAVLEGIDASPSPFGIGGLVRHVLRMTARDATMAEW
jgi:hypothetical protein